jgi:UDP-N-acetylglucosamine 2-epimerase (non-hydrolysing)
LAEAISQDNIYVTGNTIVDALLQAQKKIASDPKRIASYKEKFPFLKDETRLILVTGHRRENFGKAFEDVCLGLRDVALANDIQVVYPVHLNPNVQLHVLKILNNVKNVHLIEPVDYESLVYLMSKSYMVVTDSGGIQEEAPSLGKPVLVTRDTTERPEGIEAGTAILVGTNRHKLAQKMTKLLTDQNFYLKMARAQNPYGDGFASHRISEILVSQLYESSLLKAA